MFWQGRRNRTKRRAHTRARAHTHTLTHLGTMSSQPELSVASRGGSTSTGRCFLQFLKFLSSGMTEEPIFNSLCSRHRAPGPCIAHGANHHPPLIGSLPLPLNKVLFLPHECFQPSIGSTKTYMDRQSKFHG